MINVLGREISNSMFHKNIQLSNYQYLPLGNLNDIVLVSTTSCSSAVEKLNLCTLDYLFSMVSACLCHNIAINGFGDALGKLDL